MRIATTIADVPAREPGKRRVLVPTMGALHKAHGELIKVARENAGKNGEVVASIFVNPLQFEPGSDYERYPRPEKEDEEFCRQLGVDLLFRPTAAEMYADNRSVFIDEDSLSVLLEGRSRPGHFRGVCMVVHRKLRGLHLVLLQSFSGQHHYSSHDWNTSSARPSRTYRRLAL